MAVLEGLVGVLLQQQVVGTRLEETTFVPSELVPLSMQHEKVPSCAPFASLDPDSIAIIDPETDVSALADEIFDPDMYTLDDVEDVRSDIHAFLDAAAQNYVATVDQDEDNAERKEHWGYVRGELQQMADSVEGPQKKVFQNYVQASAGLFAQKIKKLQKEQTVEEIVAQEPVQEQHPLLPYGLLGLGALLAGAAVTVGREHSPDPSAISNFLYDQEVGRFLVYTIGNGIKHNIDKETIREQIGALVHGDYGGIREVPDNILKALQDSGNFGLVSSSFDDYYDEVQEIIGYDDDIDTALEQFRTTTLHSWRETLIHSLATDFWQDYATHVYSPKRFIETEFVSFLADYVESAARLPEGEELGYAAALERHSQDVIFPQLRRMQSLLPDNSRNNEGAVHYLADRFGRDQDLMLLTDRSEVREMVAQRRAELAKNMWTIYRDDSFDGVLLQEGLGGTLDTRYSVTLTLGEQLMVLPQSYVPIPPFISTIPQSISEPIESEGLEDGVVQLIHPEQLTLNITEPVVVEATVSVSDLSTNVAETVKGGGRKVAAAALSRVPRRALRSVEDIMGGESDLGPRMMLSSGAFVGQHNHDVDYDDTPAESGIPCADLDDYTLPSSVSAPPEVPSGPPVDYAEVHDTDADHFYGHLHENPFPDDYSELNYLDVTLFYAGLGKDPDSTVPVGQMNTHSEGLDSDGYDIDNLVDPDDHFDHLVDPDETLVDNYRIGEDVPTEAQPDIEEEIPTVGHTAESEVGIAAPAAEETDPSLRQATPRDMGILLPPEDLEEIVRDPVLGDPIVPANDPYDNGRPGLAGTEKPRRSSLGRLLVKYAAVAIAVVASGLTFANDICTHIDAKLYGRNNTAMVSVDTADAITLTPSPETIHGDSFQYIQGMISPVLWMEVDAGDSYHSETLETVVDATPTEVSASYSGGSLSHVTYDPPTAPTTTDCEEDIEICPYTTQPWYQFGSAVQDGSTLSYSNIGPDLIGKGMEILLSDGSRKYTTVEKSGTVQLAKGQDVVSIGVYEKTDVGVTFISGVNNTEIEYKMDKTGRVKAA